MRYADQVRAVLSPAERGILNRLSTPRLIQDYLDALPINFEVGGDTYKSLRRVIVSGSAHCFEGAVFAAAALAYHGERPLLLDFQTLPKDVDHVVTLFRKNGYWGAMSKTNHAIVRWRDPIYRSVRELAMSYFHEYMLWNGTKSLVAYSAPFDLSRYPPAEWITTGEDLDAIALALDRSTHFPAVPTKNRRLLRRGSPIELRAMKLVEWKEPRGYDSGA